MKAQDIMTPHVEVIPPDMTVQAAAEKMSQLDVGLLPVCDGDRLIGMLTDRDITVRATAKGSAPTTTPVREVMTTVVVYCFADQDVEIPAQMMEMRQIRRVPVVNRAQQLVEIVSLGDVAVETGNRDLSGETLEQVSAPAQPAGAPGRSSQT